MLKAASVKFVSMRLEQVYLTIFLVHRSLRIAKYSQPSADGKKMLAIFDDDSLRQIKNNGNMNISEADLLVMVKEADMPKRKPQGSVLLVDGKACIVEEWSVSNGMVSIFLRQPHSS